MVDLTTLLLLTHITSKDAIVRLKPSHPPACSRASKPDQTQSSSPSSPDCMSSPETVSSSLKPSFSNDQPSQESVIFPLLSKRMVPALGLPRSFTKLPKMGYSPPVRQSAPGVLLKVGSQGHIVVKLQGKLQALGYYPKDQDIDGVYGQQTLAAVAKFQQAEGLRADGIVGPSTWIKLQARLQNSVSKDVEENLEAKQRRRKLQSIPLPKIAQVQVIEETPKFSPSQPRKNPSRPSENSPSLHSKWAEANLASPSPSPTQPIPQKQEALPRQSVITPSSQPDLLGRWLSVWALVYVGGMVHILGKSSGGIGSEFLSAILKSKRLKPTLKTDSPESQALANEQEQVRDTLIGVFPICNPETGNCYTYSLVNNVDGYFILIDNELRLADSTLLNPQTDMAYTVTVRRTDENGRTVDKSFVVRIPKSGEPKVEDLSRKLVRA